MKKLRLLLMTALLTVLGGGSVLAFQERQLSIGEGDAITTFTYASNVLSWNAGDEGSFYFKSAGDVSKYNKLIIDVSPTGEETDIPSGIKICLGSGSTSSLKMDLINGTNTYLISDLLADGSTLQSSSLGNLEKVQFIPNTENAGSIKINSVKFYSDTDIQVPKLESEPTLDDKMIRKSADLSNVTDKQGLYYESATHLARWSSNNYNLMKITGLPLGKDAANYTKLYVKVSVIEGQTPRLYIYQNTESTQYFLHDGINVIDFPNDLEITEYRLGGANWLNGGTMTGSCVFHYVYAEGPKVKKIQGNEYIEKTLTQKDYTGGSTNYNLGSSTGTVYGSGSGDDGSKYADISAYDYLRLVVTEGTPRLFMFVEGETSCKQIRGTSEFEGISYMTFDGVDTYLFDIQKFLKNYAYARLGSIKAEQSWLSVTVTSLTLLKKGDCGYVLSGTGELTDVASALADKTLTSVDATGLTNEEAIEISTGNPNCLIIANTGKLSNPDNVLIKGADDSYSCASLSLMDANDFAAPVAFTATIAKLARVAKGYDGWATVCLPFEASVPSGVKAWEIESVNAGVLNMKSITTIPANKAVLLQFDEATGLAVYASSATVSKTVAASESGKTELVGVYAKQQAPVGSYALQKNNGTLAFYKVETDKQPNIPAFRAYLVVNSEGAKPNMMGINFEETTGISDMQNNETILTPAMKYNMAGQSVQHMKKGVQIQRMSDGSVRKVMVK